MKVLVKVTAIILVTLFMSCESKDKEIETLKTETMAVHDEVMPKMDDIMKLKKSLKEIEDSTAQDEIMKLVIALEESDKAMMNWMRNYDPKMEGMTDDEKIEYLKNKKASIEKVSEQMKSSISASESYLKK
jgi:hypothetical protein